VFALKLNLGTIIKSAPFRLDLERQEEQPLSSNVQQWRSFVLPDGVINVLTNHGRRCFARGRRDYRDASDFLRHSI
jgi:hypothetical protein